MNNIPLSTLDTTPSIEVKDIRGRILFLKSKKETAAYFYIILTLFTVAFFGFFALRPAFSTISNLQRQLQDGKTVYTALQTKLATLQSLDGGYKSLEADLPLVYDAIPTTPQTPTLMRQIENLALENNLVLDELTSSTVEYYPLQGSEALYSYTFTLSASGAKGNIDSFIEEVSSFNRLVTIEKITTGKNEKGQLELSLTGKVYFVKN